MYPRKPAKSHSMLWLHFLSLHPDAPTRDQLGISHCSFCFCFTFAVHQPPSFHPERPQTGEESGYTDATGSTGERDAGHSCPGNIPPSLTRIPFASTVLLLWKQQWPRPYSPVYDAAPSATLVTAHPEPAQGLQSTGTWSPFSSTKACKKDTASNTHRPHRGHISAKQLSELGHKAE